MSSNRATYASLVLLLILGVLYFNATLNLPNPNNDDKISHSYFPFLLSIMLFVLIAISFIKTFLQKKDSKLEMSNFKLILLTILITIIYITTWQLIGFFYPLTFIFIFTLLTMYRWSIGLSKKDILIHIVIGLIMTLIIYLLFGMLMTIRF